MNDVLWGAVKLWLVMHPVVAGLMWSRSTPEHAGRKSGRMALVGVLVSMVVLILAVLLAEPALDWLGITEPTLVMGVGALMVISVVPVWTPVRALNAGDRGWSVALVRLWIWLASPAVIGLAAWVSLDDGIFTAIDSSVGVVCCVGRDCGGLARDGLMAGWIDMGSKSTLSRSCSAGYRDDPDWYTDDLVAICI